MVSNWRVSVFLNNRARASRSKFNSTEAKRICPLQTEPKYYSESLGISEQISTTGKLCFTYRGILVYNSYLISISMSVSNEAINQLLILKGHSTADSVNECEPDVLNTFFL